MCEALNYAQKIMNIIQEIAKENKRLGKIVHHCDLKTCDLIHEIELNNIGNLWNAYLIVKEIKEVRQTRRKAKNEIEYLQLFSGFIAKNMQEEKYEGLIQRLNKRESDIKNRKYNPRIDCKLTKLNV